MSAIIVFRFQLRPISLRIRSYAIMLNNRRVMPTKSFNYEGYPRGLRLVLGPSGTLGLLQEDRSIDVNKLGFKTTVAEPTPE